MNVNRQAPTDPLFRNKGRCPICEVDTTFNAWGANLRDTYLCGRCGSLPRERALMHALTTFYPRWRELTIHESSPSPRGVSSKLARECAGYLATQYHPAVLPGTHHPTEHWRCEDLQQQSFSSDSFDLVITQDVFEHIFNPAKAIAEIARTLKPGGAHLATTPLVRGIQPTIRCAERTPDGSVIHHVPPDYHMNPVDAAGSLVTFWWGYDIAHLFNQSAPVDTLIFASEIPELGVAGPLTEVLVSVKRAQERKAAHF